MGLFSFIKNAGAKVFGIGKTTEEEAKDLALKLSQSIEQYNLNVRDLNIEVEGDIVKVWGEAESLATKEKAILVLGNTEGIASVDDRMTIKEPEIQEGQTVVPEAQFYTVVSGDTLSKISKTYYGDPMQYPTIFEANKPMLEHPDKIYPGQVLRIPTIKG